MGGGGAGCVGGEIGHGVRYTDHMTVSESTYKLVALEDPEGQWELHCGHLRSKPQMTMEHNDVTTWLGVILQNQLSREAFRVRVNSGRTRTSTGNYFIPDIFVIPTVLVHLRLDQPETLETYPEPLPLVVEVWSRSTGGYDVAEKVPEYQRRGDMEVWLVHPYERTLTAFRKGEDGSYTERVYGVGELVECVSLPGVFVDLGQLFD